MICTCSRPASSSVVSSGPGLCIPEDGKTILAYLCNSHAGQYWDKVDNWGMFLEWMHIQGIPKRILLRGHEPPGLAWRQVLCLFSIRFPPQSKNFDNEIKPVNAQSPGFLSSLPVTYERSSVAQSGERAHFLLDPSVDSFFFFLPGGL